MISILVTPRVSTLAGCDNKCITTHAYLILSFTQIDVDTLGPYYGYHIILSYAIYYGTLTDEAFRNGSIKKNHENRGNRGEPSKDRNVKDDNKRTRTGNAFAIATNPVGRENMSTVPKCTTCNTYHPPMVPCRTCFNCNRPSHFAKDCRVVPRNVNPMNARNPAAVRGAYYECGSTDHYKSACPRLNRAQGPRGNRPNQALANNEARVVETNGTR
ncbi:putative reverse transcriptase domain-containing protein [Tanacetum coccineum]